MYIGIEDIELYNPNEVMMRKNSHEYTTIQISKEINKHIREFCKANGLVASTLTEQHWIRYISSSVSGSIFLQG